MVELSKKFRFEAAHWLPKFPEGHKCRRLHGHSFQIEVIVRGEIDENTGILLDFNELKAVVKPIIDALDHHCINNLGEEWNEPLLKNPTAENLAKWLYEKIKPQLNILYAVVVNETCTSKCVYYGE